MDDYENKSLQIAIQAVKDEERARIISGWQDTKCEAVCLAFLEMIEERPDPMGLTPLGSPSEQDI